MKKLLLLLTAACCIASCAEIRTTYIGKAYPTTGTAPELYFDWKDVPSDYETMGSIKATPFGKTLAEVTPEEKNQVSHRAVALRAFYDKLKEEGYADK